MDEVKLSYNFVLAFGIMEEDKKDLNKHKEQSLEDSFSGTKKGNESCCNKTLLEVIPSSDATVLAAVLANIMSEGLTNEQASILGVFIASVGTLISYRSSRGDLCDE